MVAKSTDGLTDGATEHGRLTLRKNFVEQDAAALQIRERREEAFDPDDPRMKTRRSPLSSGTRHAARRRGNLEFTSRRKSPILWIRWLRRTGEWTHVLRGHATLRDGTRRCHRERHAGPKDTTDGAMVRPLVE